MEGEMTTAFKVVKDIASWRQQACYLAFIINSQAFHHFELTQTCRHNPKSSISYLRRSHFDCTQNTLFLGMDFATAASLKWSRRCDSRGFSSLLPAFLSVLSSVGTTTCLANLTLWGQLQLSHQSEVKCHSLLAVPDTFLCFLIL